MLVKFTDENFDLDTPHFDLNDVYIVRVTLPIKDISAYGSSVEGGSKSSHKLLEFLMVKSLKKRRPLLFGALETREGDDGLLRYAYDDDRIRPHNAFIPRFLR
jgi:hypothetical protein